MSRSIAIVILNYRTPEMTLDCLRSLAPEVAVRGDVCVAVVDNASGDGSAEKISQEIARQQWDWASVTPLSTNAGFSAGNNAGVQWAIAHYPSIRWLVLLNSDTIVRPGALSNLVAAGEADERIGLIGPRLEWPDGRGQSSCFRNISPLTEFLSVASTGPLCRLFGRGEAPIDADPATEPIEWISFACVALRRETFEQVGPMDEGFFLYFEDVDYCRRVRAAGWKIAYAPESHVVHLRGGTSPVKALGAARRRRPKYFYASRNRYLAKFYGRTGLALTNVLWHCGRCISGLRELVRHKSPHTCQRESIDIWTRFFSPLKGGYPGDSRSP